MTHATGRGRPMTTERLLELRAAAARGMNAAQICREYSVSDNTLRRYAVFGPVVIEPTNKREHCPATPEEADAIERMIGVGEPLHVIASTLNLSYRQVRKVLQQRGLKLMSHAERQQRGVAKQMGPKKIRRRPSEREATQGGRLVARNGQAPEWAPGRDVTDLQVAVTRLRRKYVPVCAEATIAKRHFVPEPYTEKTLFRVGRLQNVPAAKLLEMARHA